MTWHGTYNAHLDIALSRQVDLIILLDWEGAPFCVNPSTISMIALIESLIKYVTNFQAAYNVP